MYCLSWFVCFLLVLLVRNILWLCLFRDIFFIIWHFMKIASNKRQFAWKFHSWILWKIIIEALTALVVRLSLSVSWENGPERARNTVSFYLNFMLFKQVVQTLTRRCVLRLLICVSTVCQCRSPGLTDNPLYIALWRHRDKNSAVINNSYLGFD